MAAFFEPCTFGSRTNRTRCFIFVAFAKRLLTEISSLGASTALRRIEMDMVEKGGFMDYEAPSIEVVGSASELIQVHLGPRYDGGPYSFSQGFTVCSPLEEEEQA